MAILFAQIPRNAVAAPRHIRRSSASRSALASVIVERRAGLSRKSLDPLQAALHKGFRGAWKFRLARVGGKMFARIALAHGREQEKVGENELQLLTLLLHVISFRRADTSAECGERRASQPQRRTRPVQRDHLQRRRQWLVLPEIRLPRWSARNVERPQHTICGRFRMRLSSRPGHQQVPLTKSEGVMAMKKAVAKKPAAKKVAKKAVKAAPKKAAVKKVAKKAAVKKAAPKKAAAKKAAPKKAAAKKVVKKAAAKKAAPKKAAAKKAAPKKAAVKKPAAKKAPRKKAAAAPADAAAAPAPAASIAPTL